MPITRLQKRQIFRLFDLPVAPLQSVFKFIGFLDLFDLSLCSKKSRKMMKSTSRIALQINIMVREKSIKLWFVKFSGSWIFGSDSMEGGKKEIRTIKDHTFRLQKLAPNASSTSPHPDITLKLVLSTLQKIFDCHISMDIWTDHLGPLHNYLTSVDHFENFKCRGSKKLSIEDRKFILEELKVAEQLELDSCCEENSNIINIINLTSKSVILENWKTISPRSFVRSDCEQIVLITCNFSLDTYELFVSRWMSGSFYRKLEHVRIFETKDVELKILKSRGAPWNPKRRAKYFILDSRKAVDCSEGIDILRSDGTLATVITKYKMFRMFVWNERFPLFTENHRVLKFYEIW